MVLHLDSAPFQGSLITGIDSSIFQISTLMPRMTRQTLARCTTTDAGAAITATARAGTNEREVYDSAY